MAKTQDSCWKKPAGNVVPKERGEVFKTELDFDLNICAPNMRFQAQINLSTTMKLSGGLEGINSASININQILEKLSLIGIHFDGYLSFLSFSKRAFVIVDMVPLDHNVNLALKEMLHVDKILKVVSA